MRSRDNERDQWFRLYNEQRLAFQEERERWEAERARLINALLAKTSGEFAVRQRASGPEPLVTLPKEAREPSPQPMGM